MHARTIPAVALAFLIAINGRAATDKRSNE
jgi:hypothetical protein